MTHRKTLLLLGLFMATAAQAQDNAAPTAPSANPAAGPATSPTAAPPAAVPAPPPAGAGASGAASEEPSPFVFGIHQSLTSDSNLFRAPDGPLVRRDRISSTGLRLGVDKPFGRQHFMVDLQANANRYNHNKQLNNTDYSANARLDWETVERISGELSAQQRQSLFRDSLNGVVSTDRNQVRSSALAFQARVGLVTRWSFEGGMAASEDKYTGATVENRDVRQTSINGGLRYRASSASSARVGLRRTEGRYPRLAGGNDHFTRNDLDLIGTFNPSGASSLNARVSATRERHDAQLQRDNNGWTGALGWNWRPTGKLDLAVDLSRDRSVGRTGFDTSLIGTETSDTNLSEAASLALTWAATAKISVVPRAAYVRRRLDNTFSATGTGATQTTDRTASAGLEVRYVPLTALALSCNVMREQRRVDGDSPLTTPYNATVAGCSADFALR